jgi:tetratricopeptide (TPR) repeat protein
MFLRSIGVVVLVFCAGASWALISQSGQPKAPPKDQAKNPASAAQSEQSPTKDTQPASEDAQTAAAAAPVDDRNVSSSRSNIIDLSPPKGDLKEHPDSAAATAKAKEEADAEDREVEEFHPWNPMKALKDVEVGDYYFKKKNYRAALDRYKEALVYKDNDAVATYRLAVCQEQMGDITGALDHYAAYLKILPHGPFADDAQEAIERLKAQPPKANAAVKEVAPLKP